MAEKKQYAIASEGEYSLQFFYENTDGFIILTRIVPTTYPNKKKAKRMLKRLNKYHGNDWFLYNYGEFLKHSKKKPTY